MFSDLYTVAVAQAPAESHDQPITSNRVSHPTDLLQALEVGLFRLLDLYLKVVRAYKMRSGITALEGGPLQLSLKMHFPIKFP